MKTTTRSHLAAILIALTPTLALAQVPRYLAQDLGTFGATYVYATSVNNAGQVAGGFGPFLQDDQNPVEHAFVYKNGVAVELGSVADGSTAHRISSSGKVTGIFWTSVGRPDSYLTLRSFVSERSGVIKDLGTLGGDYSCARDINSAGLVIGTSTLADGRERAFLYRAGKMRDLGTLGGARSGAWGINDAGQIVGHALTTGDSYHRACLWSNDHIIDLGIQGMAVSINNSVQIVGMGFLPSGWNAFFLDSTGRMVDFGPLVAERFGADSSQATRINNAGQVVGLAFNAGINTPFLWSNGELYDVNSLVANSIGTTFSAVTDLNDRGQMVANGADSHAYLLTPFSNAELQAMTLQRANPLKGRR